MGAHGSYYTLPVARVRGVNTITALEKLIFIYATFPPLSPAVAAAAVVTVDAAATFTVCT